MIPRTPESMWPFLTRALDRHPLLAFRAASYLKQQTASAGQSARTMTRDVHFRAFATRILPVLTCEPVRRSGGLNKDARMFAKYHRLLRRVEAIGYVQAQDRIPRHSPIAQLCARAGVKPYTFAERPHVPRWAMAIVKQGSQGADGVGADAEALIVVQLREALNDPNMRAAALAVEALG